MATSYLSESLEVDRKLVIAGAFAMRCEMSQVLLDIASGNLNLSDVLIKNADHAATQLYVVKALEAIQGIGKVKARRLMADLEITEKRRIESLSVNERQLLLKKIEISI